METTLTNLLNLINTENIIDTDDVNVRICKMVIQMKHDSILKNHPYEIFLSKDGRYRTYVMDNSKRRMIAKSTKEDVEDALIQFYIKMDNSSKRTLKTLYTEWLDYKLICSTSSNTVKRIDNDWNKYYIGTKIIEIPITKLDYITLNQWAYSIIKEKKLTRKQYGNLALIMKQSLLYATSKGYISSSPFERVKLKSALFRKSPKHESEAQVFLTDEQPKIEAEAWNEFNQTGNPIALAIPLAFQTGLRIGEIVALKPSDIQGNYLIIERMEVRQPHKSENGWDRIDYVIVDHTKSTAGTRQVYLTKKSQNLLNAILKANQKLGYENNEYLFNNVKGRIHARALDHRIRKYCNKIGISEKSMHKIRKTFISTLIDHNVNINYIREIVGHESEETTYHSYCFNRTPQNETEQLIEQAL